MKKRSARPQGRYSTPFNRLIGARRVQKGSGRALYALTVGPVHLNRRGVAHGGVVASLLDMALGAAVVTSIEPQEWCGTVQISVQFREPVRPGKVRAEGRMVRRGRSVAFAEGELRDSAGKVLATAHGAWTIWPVKPT